MFHDPVGDWAMKPRLKGNWVPPREEASARFEVTENRQHTHQAYMVQHLFTTREEEGVHKFQPLQCTHPLWPAHTGNVAAHIPLYIAVGGPYTLSWGLKHRKQEHA